MEEKTIFQKLIERDIPCDVVLENDNVMAFLDAHPKSKGHTLVITKYPYRNVYELQEHDAGPFMSAISLVSKGVKEALGADGINVVINNDKAAGQVVFHLHAHIIPRYDGVSYPLQHMPYDSNEERKSIAKSIATHCNDLQEQQ